MRSHFESLKNVMFTWTTAIALKVKKQNAEDWSFAFKKFEQQEPSIQC